MRAKLITDRMGESSQRARNGDRFFRGKFLWLPALRIELAAATKGEESC